MESDPKPVYYSVADPNGESTFRTGAVGFERSLLWNVLFQSSVLIPDAFFFTSEHLESHVFQTPSKSLLEACIEQGIVYFSVRDKDRKSFTKIESLLREQGITGLSQNSKRIALRLERSLTADSKFSTWYGSSALNFERAMIACLKRDQPTLGAIRDKHPEVARRIDNAWRVSQPWRFEVLERAVDATKLKDASGGLRRGELVAVLAEDFGVDPNTVTTFGALLERAKFTPEQRSAMELYGKWTIECYQFSQAISLHSKPNLAQFSPYSSVVLNALAADNPFGDQMSPHEALKYVDFEILRIEATLPLFEMLSQLSPATLLNIRSNSGRDYFCALDMWSQTQSDSDKAALVKAFNSYCREITNAAERKLGIGSHPIELLLNVHHHPARRFVTQSLQIAFGVVESVMSPWHIPFITVGSLGIAVYQWKSGRGRHEVHLPTSGLPQGELISDNAAPPNMDSFEFRAGFDQAFSSRT